MNLITTDQIDKIRLGKFDRTKNVKYIKRRNI